MPDAGSAKPTMRTSRSGPSIWLTCVDAARVSSCCVTGSPDAFRSSSAGSADEPSPHEWTAIVTFCPTAPGKKYQSMSAAVSKRAQAASPIVSACACAIELSGSSGFVAFPTDIAGAAVTCPAATVRGRIGAGFADDVRSTDGRKLVPPERQNGFIDLPRGRHGAAMSRYTPGGRPEIAYVPSGWVSVEDSASPETTDIATTWIARSFVVIVLSTTPLI